MKESFRVVLFPLTFFILYSGAILQALEELDGEIVGALCLTQVKETAREHSVTLTTVEVLLQLYMLQHGCM